ncbi:acyl-CoA dehydrogenase family protein [Streptomyces sp. NL15-2K]|uniref:acyl-CoA dehydrogenase family protein n=1 Tax=Streptomyces sp. NL15-2K TaxID=376149 RepID=UPI000FFA09D6|nr:MULTISPECIES: acyl-CoA dehydrogenase family protein [Actinomycetes]WKX07093.1 acyl-CoA dehydrogenase family protein [Kutzneria buriramensis]GCB53434.1 acyl-CoA dehydrogenase [Streptomyces sp. NL15-2K]
MTQSSLAPITDISTPDAKVVARATELVPLVREHAAQGAEARRVVPEVVRALEDAGLFHLLVSQRWGGTNASIRTAVDVVAEVARGDGSTGWLTTLLMNGTGFASTFSDQAQQEVFGANPRAKVCGVFAAGSKSERVDGGYVVSGRWPYSSGSFVADWAILGMLLEGDDPLGAALMAGGGAAGERHLPYQRVAAQRGPDVALAVDHVEHPGRQGVRDLVQQKRQSGRGERRRLEHERVTSGQRGRELPHRQDHGHVPRHDRRRDTPGDLLHADEALLVVELDGTKEFLDQARRVLEHSGAQGEVGLRLPEHTAVLAHEQRGEFLAAARDEFRGGQQFLDTLGDGRVTPARERPVRGVHRAVHVLRRTDGHAGDDLVESPRIVRVPVIGGRQSSVDQCPICGTVLWVVMRSPSRCGTTLFATLPGWPHTVRNVDGR